MDPSVVIIGAGFGAGFGGIVAAIELKKAGYDDIVLLEKADEVGGVWRDNTYPGAACDVPSPFYSYSFEPNPNWPRRYTPQPQILDYLKTVADKYDVRRHVRFHCEVNSASWSDADAAWALVLTSGETLTAEVLVPAVGQLSLPAYPVIEGTESFDGPAFHSATWDHEVDLSGKRVGVIGTGASAIQFVPAIQPEVAHLTVFQRTPPYIIPRWDAEYGPRHRALFRRIPQVQLGERFGWFAYLETVTFSFIYAPLLAKGITAHARRHMRRQTAAVPGLLEKVWPDYPVGCKRGLLSDTYLPALTQPNVTLETASIQAIEPSGVRTADGTHHPADVIIYGTGFAASDFLAPMELTGRGGMPLEKAWADGAHACGAARGRIQVRFQACLHPSDGFCQQRKTLVDGQLNHVRAGGEVVVCEEVPHAGDTAPIDVELRRGHLSAQPLHRFANLEESHRHGVHDDFDRDRPMLEMGTDPDDRIRDVLQQGRVGLAHSGTRSRSAATRTRSFIPARGIRSTGAPRTSSSSCLMPSMSMRSVPGAKSTSRSRSLPSWSSPRAELPKISGLVTPRRRSTSSNSLRCAATSRPVGPVRGSRVWRAVSVMRKA